MIFANPLFAEEEEELPRYIPKIREHLSIKEKTINFGIVYGAQWTYYLLEQQSIIEDHGSLQNWLEYPLQPHFDNDSFDYNIFKHALTGNYYYLWYRSRGYDIRTSFMWSFISSLAFEFTIETITERPSYQDIYQTPVFGAVLGIGFENLSRYFHSWDTWYGHGLGYILNPFTLVPTVSEQTVSMTPIIDNKMVGANVSYRF